MFRRGDGFLRVVKQEEAQLAGLQVQLVGDLRVGAPHEMKDFLQGL